MERISTLFLRRELTRVIDRLVAGESFIVTHRGKVLAALQPLQTETVTATPADEPPQPTPEGAARGLKPPMKTRQQVADEILRGVRTGKRE